MDYYINEYSLRGQFRDVDEFFTTLREYTLPVLKKIDSEQGSVIWKKDDLWNANICKDVTLSTIPLKKNERSPERVAFLSKLRKLAAEQPHWIANEEDICIVEEYKFDETYRKKFALVNCFTKALLNEGRIISFIHDVYKINELTLILNRQGNLYECQIPNIYTVDWWKGEPEIKIWHTKSNFRVEVRAREFEYHSPHFHVIYKEYSGVFSLKDGKMIEWGRHKFEREAEKEIYEWFKNYNNELVDAWVNMHGEIKA